MSGHHVLPQVLYKEDIFRQRICERSVVCLILHKHHKRLTKIRLLVLPAKLAAAKGMKKHALQFLHQIFQMNDAQYGKRTAMQFVQHIIKHKRVGIHIHHDQLFLIEKRFADRLQHFPAYRQGADQLPASEHTKRRTMSF